ncbi:MAG: response regulator [Chloroflexi bacterium]|nr:response regulator [Chloroflexota bacterium]
MHITPPPEPAPPREGPLILVVDDEPYVRRMIKAALERHGFQVITAEDGASGLAAFTRHRDSIRVVLTDTVMPDMDGVELVRALRQLDQRIPIISASGCHDPGNLAELQALRVTAFLFKPFQLEELLRTVDGVVRGRANLPL